ncbi:MAG TPA: hypothetical protein VH478_22305 [Trebonia sp.]|jgi:hypothetical protein|nr:hypothetical protein [Trebonia sp.]
MVPRESPTSGEDFEIALLQAESLLRDVDRSRARVRLTQALSLGIPLAVAVMLTLAIGAGSVGALTALILAAVCAALAALAVGWLQLFILVPAVRRIGRDERAMVEITGVLRELMGTVSEREGWSASRKHLARTRIARFPISSRGSR